MKSKEILAPTTSFPRYVGDPAGSFIASWANHLRELCANVDVLAPTGEAHHYKTFGSLLQGSGAPDQLSNASFRIRYTSQISAVLNSASLLAHSLTATAKIYVGHWLVPCGLCAAISAQLHGAESVGYAHGGDIALLEKLKAGRELARFLAHHLTRIAFVSENLRHRFLKLARIPKSSIKSAVLPMGVESAEPDAHAREQFLKRAGGKKIVATVGRLVPLKGFDLLAQALRDLPVIWIAAGDGPEREQLAKAAASAKVDLHLTGQINAAQREALFQVASVFALTSRQQGSRVEGTPVSLLEAITAGVPSVASETGGVPEIAEKTGALTFEPNNHIQLRERILSILNDNSFSAQLSKKHKQAGQFYRWPNLAPRHLAFVRGDFEDSE